jgi:hypothetical protein
VSDKGASGGGGAKGRPTGPDATAARGIALVALAMIVGVFLLLKGFDSEGTLVDGDTGQPVTTEDGQNGDDGESPTTDGGGPDVSVLTPTTRPPADVSVLVANGSGVARAAAGVSDQLQPLGYVMLDPTNGSDTSTTLVYYVEGYQADAEAIATRLGVDVTNVAPMPEPLPGDIVGVADAKVLVHLGPDKAPAG